jgi:chromosome segregation ATPase
MQDAIEQTRIELQRENVQSRRFQSEREDLERMFATLKSDWERSMMEKMHEREQEFEQIRTRLEAAKQEAENQLQAEKLDKTRIESAQANARAEIDTIRKQAEQEAARLRAEAGSLRGQVERLAKDLETREGAVGEREQAMDAQVRALEAKAAQAQTLAQDLEKKLEECRQQSWTKRLFNKGDQ